MASHVLDMITMQNNFSTPEVRSIWSETNRLQKLLDVERALALAEGELGVIPAAAAQKIASVADSSRFDLHEIAEIGKTAKHSLVPTLRVLQRLAGDAGEYVHYGATTQDIVDTGMVLQLKETHAVLLRDLRAFLAALAEQAERYKNTPMAGRSHGVQAVPFTFGFKLAVYLDEAGRHLERLLDAEDRVFTGVLSGAIGTFASYGDKGPAIEETALKILGLHTPAICWHSSPDRFAEYAGILALISATLGKLGKEFYTLMRTELGEIEEPFNEGKIGSSTMPQKRNPAFFETIASLTRPVFAAASLVREGMLTDNERDAITWRNEWIGLPEASLYTTFQLETATFVVKGLQVKQDAMLKNLGATGGLISSENVMFALGKYTGKQTAHHIVYKVAMQAEETGRPFRDLLKEDATISKYFKPEEIDALIDPQKDLGLSAAVVDRVLKEVRDKGWVKQETK